MGSGHLVSSFPVAILFADLLPASPAVKLTGAGVLVFYVLVPDLEAEHSLIKYMFKPVTLPLAWLTRQVCWGVWLVTRGEKDERPRIHRGFTHTLPGCLLFGLVTFAVIASAPGGFAVAWCYGLAAFVGTMTHYFGDRITKEGVPRLTWPVPIDGHVWDRVSWGWFRVGGHGETRFVWFGLGPATVGAAAFALFA